MGESAEERELEMAMEKLQAQINEQALLVKKMLALKQGRIEQNGKPVSNSEKVVSSLGGTQLSEKKAAILQQLNSVPLPNKKRASRLRKKVRQIELQERLEKRLQERDTAQQEIGSANLNIQGKENQVEELQKPPQKLDILQRENMGTQQTGLPSSHNLEEREREQEREREREQEKEQEQNTANNLSSEISNANTKNNMNPPTVPLTTQMKPFTTNNSSQRVKQPLNKITKPKTTIKQLLSIPHNNFTKKIEENRFKYYYKNSKFFHGYKFVSILNNQKLCLVSSQHELTKVPLLNARSLPVAITISNKSYIKNAQGDYYLESLSRSKKYLKQRNLNTSSLEEDCIYYKKTGNCINIYCQFKHDKTKVALCPNLLTSRNRKCLVSSCHYFHQPNQFNSPSCKYFQSGTCSNQNCLFTHKLESPHSPICREFSYLGYCSEGLSCKFIHSFECPDIKEYGRCFRGDLCACIHNSNVLENHRVDYEIRNPDNDKVIQIVYDKNDDCDDDTASESDDDVEVIVGPVGSELSHNSDFVRI